MAVNHSWQFFKGLNFTMVNDESAGLMFFNACLPGNPPGSIIAYHFFILDNQVPSFVLRKQFFFIRLVPKEFLVSGVAAIDLNLICSHDDGFKV